MEEEMDEDNFASQVTAAFNVSLNFSQPANSTPDDAFDAFEGDLKKFMSKVEKIACLGLGITSMLLNAFVIVALVRYRRRVLKNVFYVIVLNCAVLDLLRATLLTSIGATQLFLGLSYMRHWIRMKWLLKPLNLMTIFNLLVFTSNEFIVIRYPLHYRRYCRRRVIIGVIMSCWVITILYTAITRKVKNDVFSPENIIAVLCYVCLVVVLVCYGFILRTIRKFHKSEENGEFTGQGQKINHRATTKTCDGCTRGQSKRCNSHRKWRSHLMSRHKYLLVIGTVLLVNVLFLVPYSTIQILSHLVRSNMVGFHSLGSFVQNMATVMIGVHAVCQPLCYFRMTEFRRLACCHGRAPWNRTKSFSQQKSFALTKTQVRDEDYEVDAMVEPKPRQPLLENARMMMAPINPKWGSNAVKFRAHGNQLVKITIDAPPIPIDKRKSFVRSKSDADLMPPKKRSMTKENESP